MKRVNIKTAGVAIALVLSTGIVSAALAQTAQAGFTTSEGREQAEPKKQPKLTEDQEKQLKEIKAKFQAEAKHLNNLMAEKRAHLKTLIDMENRDAKDLDKTIDELSALRGDLMKNGIAHRDAVKKILTPEQMQGWDRNAHQRMMGRGPGMRQGRGPGMGQGMGQGMQHGMRGEMGRGMGREMGFRTGQGRVQGFSRQGMPGMPGVPDITPMSGTVSVTSDNGVVSVTSAPRNFKGKVLNVEGVPANVEQKEIVVEGKPMKVEEKVIIVDGKKIKATKKGALRGKKVIIEEDR